MAKRYSHSSYLSVNPSLTCVFSGMLILPAQLITREEENANQRAARREQRQRGWMARVSDEGEGKVAADRERSEEKGLHDVTDWLGGSCLQFTEIHFHKQWIHSLIVSEAHRVKWKRKRAGWMWKREGDERGEERRRGRKMEIKGLQLDWHTATSTSTAVTGKVVVHWYTQCNQSGFQMQRMTQWIKEQSENWLSVLHDH